LAAKRVTHQRPGGGYALAALTHRTAANYSGTVTPQRAADHVRISLRTLHLRFRLIGKSFGRFLLESRLDACRNALRDRNQDALSISEIAYRFGFNDLSHFNKAFRARFDCAPRECREEPITET
jgi:AraC family transcriptional regulator, positive regulator of tynA and feaB